MDAVYSLGFAACVALVLCLVAGCARLKARP